MTFETHLVDVAGKKTQVLKGGAGPAVVFLHSALGEAWWIDWCDELAKEFTLVVPAHPGFGDSEGLELIADMEDMAFHYDDLLSALGLSRPALVGQSLGGWIAAEYAVRWPERISKLVLIDAAGLRLPEAPVPDMWAHRPPELAGMLFVDQTQPLYLMMQAFDPEHPPDAEILIPFIKAQQATARLGWNPYLHNPKLEGRLHRINCQTLVLWGEKDGLIAPAYGRRFAELIPGARLETIPDCGHLPLIERPVETVAALRGFLASS